MNSIICTDIKDKGSNGYLVKHLKNDDFFATDKFPLSHLKILNVTTDDNNNFKIKADLTIKAIGYQWYWGYEYPDENIIFDSYMIEEKDLRADQPRLLAVDNEVVVPVNKVVKVLITANDVLHAWALPSFGVKRDAVPGRINETWFKAEKEGTYYGQCSELCGIKHAFMPITVKVVSEEDYQEWLSEARVKFAKEEINNDKLKLASK